MPPSHQSVQRLSHKFPLLIGIAICSLVAGCAEDSTEFTETKRIDEKVTEAELQTYLRIVHSLPDKKLPDIPPVFALPPEWNHARTLPVGELVNEEKNLIAERWTAEWLARQLQRNRRLSRALRREKLTLEQFAGLTLAIGVSLARNTLRDNQKLEEMLQAGHIVVDRLGSDTRPFLSLPLDGKHYILQQSAWILRVDRIERLKLVPPENIALVRTHLEVLEPIFPSEFTSNPLDAVVDLLEEQGLPFEELVESGSDDLIVMEPGRGRNRKR